MRRQERACMPAQGISDSLLVKQALANDQGAFETLIHRYQGVLLQFISNYLGDYDQAHDVLQHVLLQLYICLPRLSASESLKPWLFQVARNRCIDEQRRRQRRRATHFSDLEWSTDEELSPLAILPDPRPLPEEYAEYHDLLHAFRQAVLALPPSLRAVVLLRCVDQLPFSEIGQALDMPEGTAKTYFQRARTRLRTALAAQ